MSKAPSITNDAICPKRAFKEESVAFVSDWQQRSPLIESPSWKVQRVTDKTVISLHIWIPRYYTKNNTRTQTTYCL